MPRKKTERVIKIGNETLVIREGESRTVSFPMTLRLTNGILFFIPPDAVIEKETGKEEK